MTDPSFLRLAKARAQTLRNSTVGGKTGSSSVYQTGLRVIAPSTILLHGADKVALRNLVESGRDVAQVFTQDDCDVAIGDTLQLLNGSSVIGSYPIVFVEHWPCHGDDGKRIIIEQDLLR